MDIQQIRSSYPQYDDLSDQQIADKLQSKFYPDLPKTDVYSSLSLPKDPSKPKDSFWEALSKSFSNIGPALKGSAGGALMLGENYPQLLQSSPTPFRTEGDKLVDYLGQQSVLPQDTSNPQKDFEQSYIAGKKGEAPKKGFLELLSNAITATNEDTQQRQPDLLKGISAVTNLPLYGASKVLPEGTGARLFKESQEQLQNNQPNIPQGSALDYLSQGITGLGTMAPALGVGALTGSPLLAAQILGKQAGGQTFGEQIEGGQNPEEAGAAANVSDIANTLGGLLPLEHIFKPGNSLIGKAAKTALANVIGAEGTQAVQAGINKGTIDPTMTLNDFMGQLKDVGIVAGATGGLLGAAAHPFTRGALPENLPQKQPFSFSKNLPEEITAASTETAPPKELSLQDLFAQEGILTPEDVGNSSEMPSPMEPIETTLSPKDMGIQEPNEFQIPNAANRNPLPGERIINPRDMGIQPPDELQIPNAANKNVLPIETTITPKDMGIQEPNEIQIPTAANRNRTQTSAIETTPSGKNQQKIAVPETAPTKEIASSIEDEFAPPRMIAVGDDIRKARNEAASEYPELITKEGIDEEALSKIIASKLQEKGFNEISSGEGTWSTRGAPIFSLTPENTLKAQDSLRFTRKGDQDYYKNLPKVADKKDLIRIREESLKENPQLEGPEPEKADALDRIITSKLEQEGFKKINAE